MELAADGDESAVVKRASGAAEARGVAKGDVLVCVGDRDARGHSFAACVDMVRAATGAGGLALAFMRKRKVVPAPRRTGGGDDVAPVPFKC